MHDLSWISTALAVGGTVSAIVAWIARLAIRIESLQPKADCIACRKELEAELAQRAQASVVEHHSSALAELEQRHAVAEERIATIVTRLDELKEMVSQLLRSGHDS